MSSERFEVMSGAAALAAERWGDGAPLTVLLHAGVADRRAWRDVAPRLPGTVVAYDRRGYGETPPPSGDFSHLDDLLAVLDAAAPGTPAWLVGNSMGGALALDAAIAHPDRVAGLVLIAPAISGEPEPDVSAFDTDTARIGARLQEADDLEEVGALEAWLWLDGPSSPEGRVGGEARELARGMNAIALVHELDEEAGESGIDAWSRLEEIDRPVMLAWGDLDVPFLVERCPAVAARIPGARTHVFHGMAHLPMLEDPEAVADLIAGSIG
jgi:pimeloyl-ACP methyl ester carboxylesterase